MGQSSSQPATVLSQQPIIKNETSHEEDLVTAIQNTPKTELSPVKQALDLIDIEDRVESIPLEQIGSTTSGTDNVLDRDIDKVDNARILCAMDQKHVRSTVSKKQRKKLWKQQNAQAQQTVTISGPPHVDANKTSTNSRVQTNGDTFSRDLMQSANKHGIVDEISQSLPKIHIDSRNHGKGSIQKRKAKAKSSSTASPYENSRKIEKTAHKVSEALHDRHASGQKQAGEFSSTFIKSSALPSAYQTSSAVIPSDVITTKSNEKEERKKENRKSENRTVDLDVSETSLVNICETSKSDKFAKSEKQDQAESLVYNPEAQQMWMSRHAFKANRHHDASAMNSANTIPLGNTLASNTPGKKKLSNGQMTISELTEFNKGSQSFKSAKIKHHQELNNNSAKSSSSVTDQPSTKPPDLQNANVRDVPSPTREGNSDSDKESTSRLFRESRIESPVIKHNPFITHNGSTPKAPDSTGDIKKSNEQHDSMRPVPVDGDSEHGGSDLVDVTAGGELQSASNISSNKILNRKHGAEDGLDQGQNKRLKINNYAVSSRRSPEMGTRPHSTPSAESSRSRSPRIAVGKAPSAPTTKSKHKTTSTTKPRLEATKSKSSSTSFKSAKYVYDSESEDATGSSDLEANTNRQDPQVHNDNDAENTSFSNSRQSSKEGVDLGTESRSPYSMHDSIAENSKNVGEKSQPVTQRKPRRLPVQQTRLDSDKRRSRGSLTDQETKKLVKNYTLGSRKMGPFDKGEQEIVKAFEIRYRAEHGLSEHQFNERIHHNAHNDKSKQAIWIDLMQELPGRDRKSIQRYCRRKKPVTGTVTSRFTEEDDQQLMNLVARYGTSWVKIGQEMDRTADVLRDRYRNVLKDNATRTMERWSPLQIEGLKQAVGATAARALENVPDVKDLVSLIVWGSVSQELKGKRGRAQCANKWNDLDTKGEVSLATEIQKAIERLDLKVDKSLIDRLDTSERSDASTSHKEAAKDSEDEVVQTPESNSELKDRLQDTTE